jgi:hypothetical protein
VQDVDYIHELKDLRTDIPEEGNSDTIETMPDDEE